MRIAVFTKRTTSHAGYGGLETLNKVLCEGLVRRGHEVFVISPQADLPVLEEQLHGVKYTYLPAVYRQGGFLESVETFVVNFIHKLKPNFDFRGILSTKGNETWLSKSYTYFKKLHTEEPFDLVLCQSSAGLGIIRHKKTLGVKVISIAHGTILSELRTKFISQGNLASLMKPYVVLGLVRDTAYVLKNLVSRQREFVHGSDKVIAVSNFVKTRLAAETLVSKAKLVVINNGMDETLFSARPQHKPDKITLVFLGRIERSKGVFLLLELVKNIISQLPGHKLNLTVIGAGPELKTLQDQAMKAGISQYVTFLGNLPHEQALLQLQCSDIFVMPTLRIEGFPMVLIEAMFARLPIVCFDAGGCADAVLNAFNGFLIPKGATMEFKTGIINLITDSALRETMATNSWTRANQNFTLTAMLDKYEKIFNEVIAA